MTQMLLVIEVIFVGFWFENLNKTKEWNPFCSKDWIYLLNIIDEIDKEGQKVNFNVYLISYTSKYRNEYSLSCFYGQFYVFY